MIAGFASASSTCRPADPSWQSTTAVGGRCCSSCGSITSSRVRWAVPARDPVRPAAREVIQPHEVLALMPSVIERESESAADELASRLAEPLISPNGANRAGPLRPVPRLRPAVKVAEPESATESAIPTVLV
jgi:hypothetical protein